MTEAETYRELVVGKTLTNLFFTEQQGPYDYMPGINPAYYFWTVMELDGVQKLRFGNNYIVAWEDDEPLIELTHENWNLDPNLVFLHQKIVELTSDEFDQLTIHLENETTIRHTSDYGDELFIEHKNFPDPPPGESIPYERNLHMQTAEIKQKWWKRFIHKRE